MDAAKSVHEEKGQNGPNSALPGNEPLNKQSTNSAKKNLEVTQLSHDHITLNKLHQDDLLLPNAPEGKTLDSSLDGNQEISDNITVLTEPMSGQLTKVPKQMSISPGKQYYADNQSTAKSEQSAIEKPEEPAEQESALTEGSVTGATEQSGELATPASKQFAVKKPFSDLLELTAVDKPTGDITTLVSGTGGSTPHVSEWTEGQAAQVCEQSEGQSTQGNEQSEGQTTQGCEQSEGQAAQGCEQSEGQAAEASKQTAIDKSNLDLSDQFVVDKQINEITQASGAWGSTVLESEQPEEPVTQGSELSEEPVSQGSEQPEEPVTQGSELSEEPVSQGSELSEEPVVQGSEQSEEPVTQGSELSEEPVTQGSELSEEPVVQGSELSEGPTSETPDESVVFEIRHRAPGRKIETNEVKQALGRSIPNVEDQGNVKTHFTMMRGLIALLVATFIFYILRRPVQSSDSNNSILQIFHDQFKTLKADFPGQSEDLWLRSGKMLEKHLNKSHPPEPATFILTAAQDGEQTLRCFSNHLAKTYALSRNARSFEVHGPSMAELNGITTKLQIDNDLSSGFESNIRAAVFSRLETLPPSSLLILYKYCDHEHAAFKNVALVLTVLLEEQSLNTDLSLTELEEKVKDFLWERFTTSDSIRSHHKIDSDKLSGVWSRISHLVLPVLPVEHIETGGCPLI
ncbi:uncharacterized protein LOC142099130 [Mixophyes fleayi]|uniref:uncharacterized protein LOC142099130 n=1 Tax=Mixophyes fleayi TaxID=3061075 RepID=UPI003F4E10BA